jgi:protein gp37
MFSVARFLSVEPQREAFRLNHEVGQVHWVIQGGESGPRARAFDVNWARQLLGDCRAQGTAYFLKQLGENPMDGETPLQLKHRHGGQWSEWPADLRVREVPNSGESG